MQHKGTASRRPVSSLTFSEADFDGQPTISTIKTWASRSAILRHISKDLQGIDDDEAHGSSQDRTPQGSFDRVRDPIDSLGGSRAIHICPPHSLELRTHVVLFPRVFKLRSRLELLDQLPQ